MNTLSLLRGLTLCAFLGMGRFASAADEPSATVASLAPPAYTMSIACFSDTLTKEPEWILVLGQVAFRSIDALKAAVTHFPKGSTLTYAPSCTIMGGEPLSSEAERKGFEEHCKANGIRFILVPSG